MITGGNVGSMDTQFLIEGYTTSRDSGTGEEILTWSTFANVWGGEIKNVGSRELIESDQQVALQTARWKIRYIDGLNEKMRINLDGEISYISGIEKIDRKKFLILSVEKRDNNG